MKKAEEAIFITCGIFLQERIEGLSSTIKEMEEDDSANDFYSKRGYSISQLKDNKERCENYLNIIKEELDKQ